MIYLFIQENLANLKEEKDMLYLTFAVKANEVSTHDKFVSAYKWINIGLDSFLL